jgi:hypothetical protein
MGKDVQVVNLLAFANINGQRKELLEGNTDCLPIDIFLGKKCARSALPCISQLKVAKKGTMYCISEKGTNSISLYRYITLWERMCKECSCLHFLSLKGKENNYLKEKLTVILLIYISMGKDVQEVHLLAFSPFKGQRK